MDCKKNDQIIYLKDLLFVALYQWRRILITALAFALLIGSFVGLSAWKSASAIQAGEYDAAVVESYLENKALLEKALNEASKNTDNQTEYLSNSILMSLNPYAVYYANAILAVRVDSPSTAGQSTDYSTPILHAYEALLKNNEIIHTVATALKMESQYLAELVLCESDDQGKILNITVLYPTADGAQNILTLILEQVNRKLPYISQSIQKHEIIQVAFGTTQQRMLSILDAQREARTYLEELRTVQEDAQSELDQLPIPSPIAKRSLKDILKTSALYAALGAFLGGIIVVCSTWVGYLSSSKVYSARTLQSRLGIKILGRMPSTDKSNTIDRWLKKLENRSVGAHQSGIVAANIRNYCLGKKHLLITGACDELSLAFMADTLKAIGVETISYGNLLRSTDALAVLPECDVVLLVEKCACSRYNEIQRIRECIADQGKDLLGCVLLDG